jgi:serine protease Do
MRSALSIVLVLGLASWAGAAERPQPPESFAPVADAVKAAVVSVVMPQTPVGADEQDDHDVSDSEIFRRLFEALTTLPNRTLGAAMIVDPTGIAVTGARILRDLTQFEVVMMDGHRYRATVMGRDDRTDVAVLRIAAPAPLPTVRFANSDEVRVGDWVLAVGSPYGFEASVSAGIVSARARVTPGGAYGDMLQTDAAINHGSAGGPLVNIRGEVVGLAATAAPRGAGIAFAVPSNVVRKVMHDLVAHGRVVRSWLGIAPQPLSADLAHALRAPLSHGLLIADLAPDGPAAKAGLGRRDIVLAFDRLPLRTEADLQRALAMAAPGETRLLEVWRNGRSHPISVVLAQEPEEAVPSMRRFEGLVAGAITPEIGVVVASVLPGTAAGNAGFLRGDVLREIDGVLLRTPADFDRATSGLTLERPIAVLVQRHGAPLYLVLLPDGSARTKEAR